jgi:GNAT superfamily N-acetyltransferase
MANILALPQLTPERTQAADRAARTASRENAPMLERALGFLRRNLTMTADDYRPIGRGLLVRTPSLPLVWSLNHVRVADPLGFGEAVQLADEHLGELSYRHVVVEGDAAGAALEPRFRAAGWSVERDVVMALSGRPGRAADTSAVMMPTEQQMLELMGRWMAEDRRMTPAGARQLVEISRREGRAWGERCFSIRGDDGRPAAIVKLRSDGSTAQVEDVYAVPEVRGRGFGRALVTHAVELADATGHDLTFIVADDHNWPKHLYASVGFGPVGRIWQFHRELS